MNSQPICIRFGTGAGFISVCGGVQCYRQRGVARECISHLCRCEPLWLRVCTDEVEIRIGGVGLVFSGGSLLSLELIDNPPATEIIHFGP